LDSTLHEKYKHVKFSDELVDMYIEILNQDDSLSKVFNYIAIEERRQIKEERHVGITINDIVENVSTVRATRQSTGKSYKYVNTNTKIHRKTAEKIVDKLLCMSLLYYKPVKPYKMLFLTSRGKQVLIKIVDMKSKHKEMEN
jgi:hypothetical protein